MKTTVKLSEVVNLAKTTGHLGWLKINDASKIIANASGTLQINTTIFIQNFVQKEKDQTFNIIAVCIGDLRIPKRRPHLRTADSLHHSCISCRRSKNFSVCTCTDRLRWLCCQYDTLHMDHRTGGLVISFDLFS